MEYARSWPTKTKPGRGIVQRFRPRPVATGMVRFFGGSQMPMRIWPATLCQNSVFAGSRPVLAPNSLKAAATSADCTGYVAAGAPVRSWRVSQIVSSVSVSVTRGMRSKACCGGLLVFATEHLRQGLHTLRPAQLAAHLSFARQRRGQQGQPLAGLRIDI